MTGADVLVIGGGIQGLATAVHLGLRGVRVTVLEKNWCGRHASGVNAGGVNRMGRFPEELPLSGLALSLWHRIGELVDDGCGFDATGRIKVAESDEELDRLRARYRAVRDLGHDYERMLDRQELFELEPGLAPHCVGGLLSPGCGHANPFRTVQAFRRKALALGAKVREGVRVNAVRRRDGRFVADTDDGRFEASKLVNCAGAWGDRVAAELGEPVPLAAIAPMLSVTTRMPRVMRHVIGATDRVLSIKQLENGAVVVGGGYRGTADRDAETTRLDYAKLGWNVRIAGDFFPALRDARVLRLWAGIEGRTADGLPIIGPSGTEEGAFHAFGFSAHGFHLGPAVGAVLAELIATGASNVPIDAFRIGRFAGTDNAGG